MCAITLASMSAGIGQVQFGGRLGQMTPETGDLAPAAGDRLRPLESLPLSGARDERSCPISASGRHSAHGGQARGYDSCRGRGLAI